MRNCALFFIVGSVTQPHAPRRMIGTTAAAYPPGFRPRRGLNWAFVGLLYTSFYTCRYNFAIANKSISDEFGFNKGQMGTIITTALFAYACGQILNGLLTDRIGGKSGQRIGAAGAARSDILFVVAAFAALVSLFFF